MQRLPLIDGPAITVEFRPKLTAYRGRLLSGKLETGTPVHAAAFIRQRRIVLESELLARPGKLKLILTHEIFHFVWARLGNARRSEFSAILRNEAKLGARGELGESSARKKAELRAHDREHNTRRWRDYVCESFCDTAAWHYANSHSSEFRLAARWRARRERWMQGTFKP